MPSGNDGQDPTYPKYLFEDMVGEPPSGKEIQERQERARLKNADLYELVDLARQGNPVAQSLVLREAGLLLWAGRPLPDPLRGYISAALIRRSKGASWNEAFAWDKYHQAGIRKLMKAGTDYLLMMAVDFARAKGLVTSDKSGEPGQAFEAVSEVFCLSASQVRKRYYAAKKLFGNSKIPFSRKTEEKR